jgi:hypothetical protein
VINTRWGGQPAVQRWPTRPATAIQTSSVYRNEAKAANLGRRWCCGGFATFPLRTLRRRARKYLLV